MFKCVEVYFFKRNQGKQSLETTNFLESIWLNTDIWNLLPDKKYQGVHISWSSKGQFHEIFYKRFFREFTQMLNHWVFWYYSDLFHFYTVRPKNNFAPLAWPKLICVVCTVNAIDTLTILQTTTACKISLRNAAVAGSHQTGFTSRRQTVKQLYQLIRKM